MVLNSEIDATHQFSRCLALGKIIVPSTWRWPEVEEASSWNATIADTDCRVAAPILAAGPACQR